MSNSSWATTGAHAIQPISASPDNLREPSNLLLPIEISGWSILHSFERRK